jgi:hypothetical protein
MYKPYCFIQYIFEVIVSCTYTYTHTLAHTHKHTNTHTVKVVCIGGREVRRRRVKQSVKLSILMNVHVTCSIKLVRIEYKQTWVRGPVAHLYNKHNTDNKQSLTRQNQWKMKNGSMMARRPVTSTAEHHPNKERQRLRQKSWQPLTLIPNPNP